MPGIAHIYPQGLAELSTNGAKCPVGTIRRHGNKTYKYVKFVKGAGSVVIAVGNLLAYTDLAGYNLSEVTADSSPATAVGAGIATVAVTVAQMDAANGAHGWVQIQGLSGILAPDIAGTPTVNTAVAKSDAADATLIMIVVTGTNQPVLGTVADNTGSAMRAYLNCPL